MESAHPSAPLIIAHRAGNHPDQALNLIAQGIDQIEADIWLYADRLEVRHSKTMGPLPILWDRWSLEFPRGQRLTLDLLLQAIPPDIEILLDIKGRNPRLPARLVETMRRHRPDQPILVCSQHWRQLDAFQPYSDVTLVHSIGNRRQLRAVRPRLTAIDHDAVSIHKRLLTPEVIASLRNAVSFIATWPINTETDATQMVEMGVDGLITDQPAQLLRWRQGFSDSRVSVGPVAAHSGTVGKHR